MFLREIEKVHEFFLVGLQSCLIVPDLLAIEEDCEMAVFKMVYTLEFDMNEDRNKRK